VSSSTGRVAVIVPTRNRREWLALTLRSVLAQTGVDLEVIVVDEASTDDTVEWLTTVADERIRVVRHEFPQGVATARNHGAAHAHGEWLAFVDDDDLWAPDKLREQLRAADACRADWVYTGSVNIAEDCRIVYGRPPLAPDPLMKALPHYNAVPGGGSNVVVRRTFWEAAGPFDMRLQNTEDWEMWIRLAKLGPPACVARPLIAYRVHSSNSSLNIEEMLRGTKLIEELHETTADWGLMHRYIADSCLRRGQRGDALRHFAAAATRGQLWATASDVGLILRHKIRRLAGRRHVPPRADGGAADPWITEAAAWLAHLRESEDRVHRPVLAADGGNQ
jgi:glycosyltransferase involved in cell wall biosynthesis